jgi:predicted RNA-binding Zn-ribbon protein involved in translation (DUF1610 family)
VSYCQTEIKYKCRNCGVVDDWREESGDITGTSYSHRRICNNCGHWVTIWQTISTPNTGGDYYTYVPIIDYKKPTEF